MSTAQSDTGKASANLAEAHGRSSGSGRTEPAATTAYRALERMIITLELPPSATVSEAELMQRTGFGRTPVREALQRLEWEGFVEIRPRAGIAIAPLTPTDWLQVIEARRGIEMILARSAARFLNRDLAKRFHDVSLAMRKAAIVGNVMAFLDADRQFDETLAQAAENRFAVRMAAPLQTHSRRFWFRYQREDGLTSATEHHLALLSAIIDGDEEGAADAAGKLLDLLRRYAQYVATR